VILGLGIDVVHPRRLRRWQEWPGLFERFYHPDELAECRKKGDGGLLSLAARFAAKEAFGKALGSGLRGMALRDIVVTNEPDGRPVLRTTGGARKALVAAGGTEVLLSLSHEKEAAIAVVIIQGSAPEAGG
jgi:holo-[acyl-carrier protein] synthase